MNTSSSSSLWKTVRRIAAFSFPCSIWLVSSAVCSKQVLHSVSKASVTLISFCFSDRDIHHCFHAISDYNFQAIHDDRRHVISLLRSFISLVWGISNCNVSRIRNDLASLSEASTSTVPQQPGGERDTIFIAVAVSVVVFTVIVMAIMILVVRYAAPSSAAAAGFPRPPFMPTRRAPRPYRGRVPLYRNKRGPEMGNKFRRQVGGGNRSDDTTIYARYLHSPAQNFRHAGWPLAVHNYPPSYLSAVYRPATPAHNNFAFTG